MQLVVSREAGADIAEAVTWLRDISPSLPVRFGNELERLYSLVLEHPQIIHSCIRDSGVHFFGGFRILSSTSSSLLLYS